MFEEIDDNEKAFNHCMDDIILKLSNVETMTDANEATRCEFISAILHASIDISKRVTTQDIFIVLQKDISGEESTGRVDYAIKGLEDLLCITEGNPRNIKIGYAQNLAQLESAYQTNKKKRTANQAFGNKYFDYLYGIVSTGMRNFLLDYLTFLSCDFLLIHVVAFIFSHGVALHYTLTYRKYTTIGKSKIKFKLPNK